MTADRTAFGPATTTDEVLDGLDLTGKLALVTGAASGLGLETARALTSKGATVVIAARTKEKGEEAAATIRQSVPAAKLEVEPVELDSLASIRAFAHSFLAKHDRLDLLINNAGVMAAPFSKTQDGFEMQFGVNHLGHFLLTNLIIGALLKGAPARIVNLSSRGHQMGMVDFDDPNYASRPYDKWNAYGQSKTSNILFSVELERRFGPRGVHAFAVHPGAIMTNLGRHMDEADINQMVERAKSRGEAGVQFKTTEAGAATSTYAATAPELEGKGGIYLEDCGIAEVIGDAGPDMNLATGVFGYALDPAAAKRLWALSEELVGQTFTA